MSNATTAIIIGFMLFFAGGTAFILVSDTTERTDLNINIIATVNINGSGIFATESLGLSLPAYGLSESELDAWKETNLPKWSAGLVFMTPGAASIQHVMLNKFVVETLGLNFAMYAGAKAAGTVYWTPVAPVNMQTTFVDNAHIDGGFPWEPFFSGTVSSVGSAAVVGTSYQLEPNHPCCMVAAKSSFLTNNETAVLRFLSAYTEAVDRVNAAIADPSSPDYERLMVVSKGFTGILDNSVINQAFAGLTYSYMLEDDLEDYTAGLVVDFEKLKTITRHVDDPAAFANTFINRTYLEKVMDEKTEENPAQKMRVRVGHLAGDIHQICLRFGMDTGIFDRYGVELVTTLYLNGPGVMNAFQLGVIDIGLLGLPPAVINTVNFR
jgi:hypothetical protein